MYNKAQVLIAVGNLEEQQSSKTACQLFLAVLSVPMRK